MSLSPQWLDELRSRVTLSSLIGRTVKITKAGREYKACCPFHHEKSPSFTINDEKGFYHCFGCGAHGDAIRWMTEHGGLGFIDAVKQLAGEAGLDVPAADPRAAQKAEEQASLRDVVQDAAHWFTHQLEIGSGIKAREYLNRRGISEKTRSAFGFGLAPDSRTALKEALHHYPADMMVEAGMLIQVDQRDPYDRFRGRLMIPIRDARGRVIAFGGRILGDGEPKYLNSPDTPLFDKGRTLYNLDKASPASRRTNRVIVVEGYMDVIALAEAGIDDAVAPLGTALTEQQITMLWRMVPVPILCFDGDAAGQKAAMRAAARALPMLQPGHSLAFAPLPSGQDPDDLVRQHGAAALEDLLSKPLQLVDKLWEFECNASPLNTPEERAALKSRLFAHADAIEHSDVRHHYREAFRERIEAQFSRKRFDSLQRQPWNSPKKMWNGRAFKVDPRSLPPGAETRMLSQSGIAPHLLAALLGGLLRYPAAISRNEEALTRVLTADSEISQDLELLEKMLDMPICEEGLDTEHMLAILRPMKVYNRATTLLRADGMHFSFNRRLDDQTGVANGQETALRDLETFIGVLVTQPEIRTRLSEATADFQRLMDEDSFARQQKLRAMDEELTQRLAALSENGLN